MSNTLDIINANNDLHRLYDFALLVNRSETQRIIYMLDQPDPSNGLFNDFFGDTQYDNVRSELVRIIQAHALLYNMTREGAQALRDLISKTNSTITISPEYWDFLTEKERIIHDYDIPRLWRTLNGDDLGSSCASGLFYPNFGDDMP